MAIRSAQVGFAQPLIDLLSDDAVLLWPGAPIVRGREDAAVLLMTLPAQVRGAAVVLQASVRTLAADSSRAFEWGVLAFDLDTAARVRPALGRFLAVWRSDREGGWRLEAFAAISLPESFSYHGPLVGVTLGSESTDSSRIARFLMADQAFAARAAEVPPSAAFAEFAAPDAVTFRGDGLIHQGPDAIATALGPMATSRWEWSPVFAGAADDGSLGWTVAETTIRWSDSNGGLSREFRSKHLTFWRILPGGEARYFAVAGSGRP